MTAEPLPQAPSFAPPRIFPILAILAVAAALRIVSLGQTPDGLFRDEAARGYDAFCILHTARGAFGGPLFPLFFQQHFGATWIEGLYNYLTVPWVALFGLTAFSTRLTAALAGTATVGIAYLLAREWFGRPAALTAAILAAVSPWQLPFSRIAFRAILMPLCITLGCWLFVTGLRKTPRLVLAGIVFGIALHTYSVARLLVPLVLLILGAFHARELIQLIRADRPARLRLAVAAALCALIAAPCYYFALAGPEDARYQSLMVFHADHPWRTAALNYLAHLSPAFLFLHGDPNPRHSLPGFGQLLAALAPFTLLAIGLAVVRPRRARWIALTLFFAGCIPAALTTEGIPHALRSIGAFPFLEMASASAIVWLCRVVWRRSRMGGMALTLAVAALIAANATIFLSAYFGPYRAMSRAYFEYGNAKAIAYAENEGADYPLVVLSDRLPCAYIFPLFYAQNDPLGFQKTRSLGRYTVANVEAAHARIPAGRALYIVSPPELPAAAVKTWIRDDGGRKYLKIVE